MNRRRKPAGCIAAAILASLLGSNGPLAAARAAPAPAADLSVVQHVSDGMGAGETTVTDHIHNAGPATATAIVTVALIRTTSARLSYIESGPTCQQEAAPSGWSYLFTCHRASLDSGSTWSPTLTMSGTIGATLTRFLSVGDSSPADPDLSNNSSTLNTYIGNVADVELSQTHTAGASPGKVTVTDTVKNRGPWTANGLQLVGEIKSAALRTVHASGTGTTCQIIPAAKGYTKAISCTTDSLTPRHKWLVTLSYTGTAGKALVQKGSVSANNPTDPRAANNTSKTSTHYAS
jgi:hypothetical protein